MTDDPTPSPIIHDNPNSPDWHAVSRIIADLNKLQERANAEYRLGAAGCFLGARTSLIAARRLFIDGFTDLFGDH